MIVVYEGIPGSSKTYSAVLFIVQALRDGRVVYTNIDGLAPGGQATEKQVAQCQEALRLYVRRTVLIDETGKRVPVSMSPRLFSARFRPLSPEQVKEFWNVVKDEAVIVIDEIHKLWSNRDWQTKGNREFSDWCSTHRHLGFDLVMITQKLEKVDAQVRTNVEWTYHYKKVNYFGKWVKNSYKEFVYPETDTEGRVFAINSHKYDRRIWRCYHSYVSKTIKERGLGRTFNVLRHPVFYILPLIFLGALYMLFFKSGMFRLRWK